MNGRGPHGGFLYPLFLVLYASCALGAESLSEEYVRSMLEHAYRMSQRPRYLTMQINTLHETTSLNRAGNRFEWIENREYRSYWGDARWRFDCVYHSIRDGIPDFGPSGLETVQVRTDEKTISIDKNARTAVIGPTDFNEVRKEYTAIHRRQGDPYSWVELVCFNPDSLDVNECLKKAEITDDGLMHIVMENREGQETEYLNCVYDPEQNYMPISATLEFGHPEKKTTEYYEFRYQKRDRLCVPVSVIAKRKTDPWSPAQSFSVQLEVENFEIPDEPFGDEIFAPSLPRGTRVVDKNYGIKYVIGEGVALDSRLAKEIAFLSFDESTTEAAADPEALVQPLGKRGSAEKPSDGLRARGPGLFRGLLLGGIVIIVLLGGGIYCVRRRKT